MPTQPISACCMIVINWQVLNDPTFRSTPVARLDLSHSSSSQVTENLVIEFRDMVQSPAQWDLIDEIPAETRDIAHWPRRHCQAFGLPDSWYLPDAADKTQMA